MHPDEAGPATFLQTFFKRKIMIDLNNQAGAEHDGICTKETRQEKLESV